MDLRTALLCVDCEWIYADATSCPRCGSHVAFPVARAMDHDQAAVGRYLKPKRAPRRTPAKHLVFVG
jgi:hypothetical protein